MVRGDGVFLYATSEEPPAAQICAAAGFAGNGNYAQAAPIDDSELPSHW